jgi:hypothetical protein
MKTKSAAKKATKSTRKPIPYASLAKMWAQGKSYEEMGQVLGIRGNEANDPYKPVRAAISNMLNAKATAWKDKAGKVCKLQPREGMRAIGVGKKVKRSKKVVSIAKGKKATKKVALPVDGKTLAAGGGK